MLTWFLNFRYKNATPLSLEEIIEAKKAKEDELSKPKFISKEEKAKIALAKRQKEADESRRRADEQRAKQREIFQQGRIQNDPEFERRQRLDEKYFSMTEFYF